MDALLVLADLHLFGLKGMRDAVSVQVLPPMQGDSARTGRTICFANTCWVADPPVALFFHDSGGRVLRCFSWRLESPQQRKKWQLVVQGINR